MKWVQIHTDSVGAQDLVESEYNRYCEDGKDPNAHRNREEYGHCEIERKSESQSKHSRSKSGPVLVMVRT